MENCIQCGYNEFSSKNGVTTCTRCGAYSYQEFGAVYCAGSCPSKVWCGIEKFRYKRREPSTWYHYKCYCGTVYYKKTDCIICKTGTNVKSLKSKLKMT